MLEITDLRGVTRICDVPEMLDLAAKRTEDGYEHLEIARSPDLYPVLTVFFGGQAAVVLRIDEGGSPAMFAIGDGTIDSGSSRTFLGPVGLETFAGEVVLSSSRATALIKAFAAGEDWPPGTCWRES